MIKNAMIRRKEAARGWGMCISQTYVQEAKGLIPKFISIGSRAKAIPTREVDAVNAARIAGKSEDEIRDFVKQLMEQRKSISVEAA